VLAALRDAPELVYDHRVQSAIQGHARRLALSSETPIELIQAFCEDVRRAIDCRSLKNRLAVTRCIGEIWAEVAFGLALASPPRVRDVVSAAARALGHDPSSPARWAWWILTRRRIPHHSGPMLRSQRQLP